MKVKINLENEFMRTHVAEATYKVMKLFEDEGAELSVVSIQFIQKMVIEGIEMRINEESSPILKQEMLKFGYVVEG